jgi:ribose/xylose/arabinose/galactoside ABC-type transport system permease subunit
VLGTLFVLYGKNTFSASSPLLGYAAKQKISFVPVVFLIFLGVLVLVWFLLTRTKFGHYVYSVGGNAEASHLSGVPVQRVQIAAFAVGGMIAGFGGLLLLGLTSTASARQSDTWALETIAICVVGGIALTGGIGRIEDVLAAALLLKAMAKGLSHLGVVAEWQSIVTGGLILIAVALDQYNRQRQNSAGRGEARPRHEQPATRPVPELRAQPAGRPSL